MTEGITKERSKPVHNKINQIGKRFGRLLVVEASDSYIQPSGKKKSMWKCKCDCGKEILVTGGNLQNGHTQSCGCFNKQRVSETQSKHRMCEDSAYSVWSGMLHRCTNTKSTNFKHYGGRGITVCDRWLEFENFYADMGDKPEGMSIDRKDNNKGYSPDNCKWSTHTEQCKNRRSTRVIEFDGKAKCLSDWARDIGIHRVTLSERLNKFPVEIALTMPPKNRVNRTQELPEDPK